MVSFQGNMHNVQVITHHKDVWTYEGAIMTIPILGTLYLDVSASIVPTQSMSKFGSCDNIFPPKTR